MKINIKNFKCWHEKSIEIKDEGIILLSGKSGKGKSSILDAIYFCLFGNGQKVMVWKTETSTPTTRHSSTQPASASAKTAAT